MVKQKIKISHGLPSKLVSNSRLLKAYSIFYQLKSFYVGSSIHNIKSRKKELAEKLNISENKLRTYLKIMGEEDLIDTIDGCLVFISNEKIRQKFDIQTVKKYHIEFTTDLTDIIRALAIEENLKKQNYNIKNHILSGKVDTKFGTINSEKIRRRLIGKNYDQVLDAVKLRNVGLLSGEEKIKFNAEATLSRGGIARLFGRRSKATGNRWVKKLSEKGLLKDEPNFIKVMSGVNQEIFRKFDFPGRFFLFLDVLYMRMPNRIASTVSL